MVESEKNFVLSILAGLFVVLAMACGGGDGGSNPTAPQNFTVSDLAGVWNVTMTLETDSCQLGLPSQIIEVWEFAAPGQDLRFVDEGTRFSVAFNDSGDLSFTFTEDDVNLTFQGRVSTAATLSGTLQATGNGCLVSYRVSGNKL